MKKQYQTILISLCLLLFAALLFHPLAAQAAQYYDYPEGFKIMPDCFKTGDCDLNDFVQMFVNLAYLGLKILPYIAMLMMIWAGFNLIMAGGNPQKIQEGKKMVTSIVLGIIIVVILAWAWSYFVVYILTCNPDQPETCKAKIFPGEPFSKEWWGGGEGVIEHKPGTGCCNVPGYGCQEVTQPECTQMAMSYGVDETTFLGENRFCYEIAATCKNYQIGCCVPKNSDDDQCKNPIVGEDYTKQTGCLPYTPTEHRNLTCDKFAQCGGEGFDPGPAFGLPDGCCVTTDSCEMVNYIDCNGTFHEVSSCEQVSECEEAGCCVGSPECSYSKIDCQGDWRPNVLCSDIATCGYGCCVNSDNCQSMIEEDCIGFGAFVSNGTGCNILPQCTGGCCVDTCLPGRLENSCAGLTYDPINTCNNISSCQFGCCLSAGSGQCIDDVRGNSCNDAGDRFFLNVQCSTRSECNTGCCQDVNNNYACYDDFARQACTDISGNYTNNAPCSTVWNCMINGCCETPDAGNPLYSCIYGPTSGVNRAYCENVINGTFHGGITCDDPSLSGRCYP